MPGSLLKSCQPLFAPSERFVGTVLARDGAVELEDVSDSVATAFVAMHGLRYRVRMQDYAVPGVRRFQCSCRPSAGSAACAHVYAAVSRLDALLQEVEDYVADPDGRVQRMPHRPGRAAEWRQRIAPALTHPPPGAP